MGSTARVRLVVLLALVLVAGPAVHGVGPWSVILEASLSPAVADEVEDAEGELVRSEVTFEVTNLDELDAERRVEGYRIDPSCETTTAVVLQHGLSYTGEAWDFAEGYASARIIAEAGYTVVAIDRLGYGRSDGLESGYLVSSESYGRMAAQIVDALGEEFDQVVLGGHSAGAEASQLAAGLFDADVVALLSLGYHQFPTEEIVVDFGTDLPATLTDDYVYFLGTPERREEMFYTDDAEEEIVDADTAAAVLTPSGELHSIGKQPSRLAAPQIDVPVFLQLAELDRLFDVDDADLAAGLFTSAPEVTVDIVAGAGHTYMLHRSGPAAIERLANWLVELSDAPPCAEPAAGVPSGAADPGDGDAAASPEVEPAGALPATGGGAAGGVVLAAAGLLGLAARRGWRR